MDLQQRKLTRDEWNSIEKPISSDELRVVQLIKDGYSNVQLKRNSTMSILLLLKVPSNVEIDNFIFTHYIQKELITILDISIKNAFDYTVVVEGKTRIRSSDRIRFGNMDAQLQETKAKLFEFILLDILKTTLKSREKKQENWVNGLYTLHNLLKYNITTCNTILYKKLIEISSILIQECNIRDILYRSKEIIEENPYLLKYADEQLYNHQKKLFTQFKQSEGRPQLVLYIAPTGTGKTLTPLGLAQHFKVIFVCAARHVGLSLANYAISSGNKVAFAFGCNDAQDIRLHYAAAKDYTKDWRSGVIRKVDNSVGECVEILICDIQSYLPAMHYMCAFNSSENIVTYWDEPTITLDYPDHPCHEIIHNIWSKNIIPNVVLSSATLPQQDELTQTIQDFNSRFDNAEVTSIISYDCKKTIPLINKDGFVEMPHYLYEEYHKVKECADYCLKNPTLLRYIDLDGCVELIKIVNEEFAHAILHESFCLCERFESLDEINMFAVKNYYLQLIKNISPDVWNEIRSKLMQHRVKKHSSNILITTNDANTLTDGPTIFLANNVNKIGLFCLQRANIHESVISGIHKKIHFNSIVTSKIAIKEKTLDDLTAKDQESGNDKKLSDSNRGTPEVKNLRKEIKELHKCILSVSLPEKYIPNMGEHLNLYTADCKYRERVFKPSITEDDVECIMLIDDVEDTWKLLLLMGIGVFALHKSVRYMEIMKQLAKEQKLYLIIASTDFIYGTNYQFCHGYISTDLEDISQEKTIQAMGRVGRNKLQQDYSVRFRNDSIIYKLFQHNAHKPEVANMTRLFNS
jgi:hypothetical protein